jgi:hypothetical protein
MCATLTHPAFRGARCGVDYTGVGRPVFDLLKQARPPVTLYPMLTTGGHAITFDEATREYHVPKSEQVGLLQVLLQVLLLMLLLQVLLLQVLLLQVLLQVLLLVLLLVVALLLLQIEMLLWRKCWI